MRTKQLPSYAPQLKSAVLFFLGAAFLFTSLADLGTTLVNRVKVKSLSDYSYELNDYPQYYPLDAPLVSMTPEDTVHFSVSKKVGILEWDAAFPKGGGFLRLGPRKRPFGLSIFHQMHCLVSIQVAIRENTPDEHAHHCLNYMRQMILCDANPTLERTLPEFGDRADDLRTERVCRDWSKVWELLEKNHFDWKKEHHQHSHVEVS